MQVEKALKAWSSGSCSIPSGPGHKTTRENTFSDATWGNATAKYARSISKLPDNNWPPIIAGAMSVFGQMHAADNKSRFSDDVSDADAREDIIL